MVQSEKKWIGPLKVLTASNKAAISALWDEWSRPGKGMETFPCPGAYIPLAARENHRKPLTL